MSDQKKNKIIIFAALAVIVVITAGSYIFVNKGESTNTGLDDMTAMVMEDENPGFPPMPEVVENTTPFSSEAANDIKPAVGNLEDESEDTATPKSISTPLDISKMMTIRAVGNPDAPIRIDEFASLTCSHCAAFHTETYSDLKEKYIDTGKVYFVFNDYPLNKPALDATITARCLPEDKYESFLNLLFKTQREWNTQGYIKALRQNAKLAGLSDEMFDQCHESSALKKALENNIREAKEGFDIQSTPTFIFNNGEETIRGSASLKTFEQVIAKLLAANE